MGGFTLTVRRGPKVERVRFGELAVALNELERRARELSGTVRTPRVDLHVRRFEPVQRVAARLELRGPGRVRAGVDVRGDGSAESYTGRLRRRIVAQRGAENAYEALRRELGAPRASGGIL